MGLIKISKKVSLTVNRHLECDECEGFFGFCEVRGSGIKSFMAPITRYKYYCTHLNTEITNLISEAKKKAIFLFLDQKF